MPKATPFLKHLLISLLTLSILLGILSFSSSYIENILTNPQSYFGESLTTGDISYFIVFNSLLITVTLISYVIYLLLTSKTRIEMQIWVKTREIVKSREQFVKIYESAPVPYIMLDKKGEIKEPNKSALRFFGTIPENIINKDFFSFYSDQYKEKAEKLKQYYVSNIPINREELDIVAKNGEIRSIQLSIFDMKNSENGENTGLAMIFDVTEQKNLDKAKTEFVSLASHQLRTPLATTKWYTEMLMSGEMGELLPKQKEYIEKLYSSNEDMVDLVDVLLNVSRIEMGSLPINNKPTNVQDLVESVISELHIQINRKGIQIEKDYGNNLKNIDNDPKLLRIVIQNLVSNAVKYTKEKGAIKIALEESIGNKRIIVSDTGIGIPKSEQGRIFDKMFRAHNAMDMTDSPGTGLGLYMVKSIVKSIGGDISFVSEENKGSTFTITI